MSTKDSGLIPKKQKASVRTMGETLKMNTAALADSAQWIEHGPQTEGSQV